MLPRYRQIELIDLERLPGTDPRWTALLRDTSMQHDDGQLSGGVCHVCNVETAQEMLFAAGYRHDYVSGCWHPVFHRDTTPYDRCNMLGHHRTASSPDGFRTIEDCEQCRLRFVIPCRIDPEGTPVHTIHGSVIFRD